MTFEDVQHSLTAAVSLVLLAASGGYAQTHKDAAMAQVAPAPPAAVPPPPVGGVPPAPAAPAAPPSTVGVGAANNQWKHCRIETFPTIVRFVVFALRILF